MSPIVFDQPLPQMSGVHPSLRSFADECSAVFVRLLAYVCGLAVLATIAVDLFTAVPSISSAPQTQLPGWTPASRPHPAFAISQLDLTGRSDAYEILRHPEGGRKDILRWAVTAHDPPTAEIEVYRTGNEVEAFAAVDADLAARMGASGETEAAGVIDTKFGPIGIVRFVGASSTKPHSCMAFAKFFDSAKVRLSGWSCQGDSPAAQRAHLACALNRLTLLSAGNDPKIAEMFARAELKRVGCSNAATPEATGWLGSTLEPQLRGSL